MKSFRLAFMTRERAPARHRLKPAQKISLTLIPALKRWAILISSATRTKSKAPLQDTPNLPARYRRRF